MAAHRSSPHRFAPLLTAAFSLFGASAPFVHAEDVSPRVRYSRALDLYNEGRIDEAQAILAKSGCHRNLGNDQEEESWLREATRRLPKSDIAQRVMLREAEHAEDPRESCRLHTGLIEPFPDHVSRGLLAARSRFDRLVEAGGVFEVKERVAAARSLEGFGYRYAIASSDGAYLTMPNDSAARVF